MTDHKPIPWLVPDKTFKPLKIPTKQAYAAGQKGYRVYRAGGGFVDVQAETVAEAIAKSGISEPQKLERLGITRPNIYQAAELASISGYDVADKMQQAMALSLHVAQNPDGQTG
jgi:predicted transcriptional regulator